MRQLIFWLFLILLAGVRIAFPRPVYPEGTALKVSGILLQEPINYSRYQKLNLAGLTVFLPKYPAVGYGDMISVSGKVVNGEIPNGQLISVEEKRLPLSDIREKIIRLYKQILPEPHASLVGGITIGAKSALPYDFWQNLTRSGTAHVVVASGMNVTLVAGFIFGLLLAFLPRKKAIFGVLTAIWLYVIFSGVEAPIVRAAIMLTAVYFAQLSGRLVSAYRVLLLTGLIMIIIFPKWITDLGFILSFIATLSMLLFEKKISDKLAFLPKPVKEGFSTSLAAQIGVAPILLVTFGNFNLLSPVVNALVLWSVPVITVLGMLGGAVGLLIRPLGALILYLTYPLTSWFIAIVNFTAKL